ncbi:hypothetical protein Pla123a_22040 [Posidoniimonas polymericola]|uniref:Uncharacterized protein n=1 Tax=Posidoniimonas polymericola TaxID=2528002 RepID=A0A5C5YRT9_9BACT|nr:hypothetical protein [Posidoniimonas polymericola]TWT77543.1 hypothetical protein Pla123a_22040 [Posidoniimonas polymericola]
MSLRDWLSPDAADAVILTLAACLFVAPAVGVVIGVSQSRGQPKPAKSIGLGVAAGLSVSLFCYLLIGPLMSEYWAG